jgi:hypothetical protein
MRILDMTFELRVRTDSKTTLCKKFKPSIKEIVHEK